MQMSGSNMVEIDRSDFLGTLKALLDGYHEVIEGMDGYNPVEGSGDDLQVLMFLNRTSRGGVRISLMSSRDFISTMHPSQMLGPEDLANFDKPTIATASVEMNLVD